MALHDYVRMVRERQEERQQQKEKEKTYHLLEERLQQWQEAHVDYQSMADEIWRKVKEKIGNIERDKPEVGDVVECTREHGKVQEKGLRGKCIGLYPLNDNLVGVEWDKNIGGHRCDGKAKLGHGYYVPIGNVRIVTVDQKLPENTKEAYDDFVERLRQEVQRYQDKQPLNIGDEVEVVGGQYDESLPEDGSNGVVVGVKPGGYYVVKFSSLPYFTTATLPFTASATVENFHRISTGGLHVRTLEDIIKNISQKLKTGDPSDLQQEILALLKNDVLEEKDIKQLAAKYGLKLFEDDHGDA